MKTTYRILATVMTAMVTVTIYLRDMIAGVFQFFFFNSLGMFSGEILYTAIESIVYFAIWVVLTVAVATGSVKISRIVYSVYSVLLVSSAIESVINYLMHLDLNVQFIGLWRSLGNLAYTLLTALAVWLLTAILILTIKGRVHTERICPVLIAVEVLAIGIKLVVRITTPGDLILTLADVIMLLLPGLPLSFTGLWARECASED